MNGDDHRETIIGVLREAPDGLDTSALAALVGLHPNTVRWHLGVLADAGLVGTQPAPSNGRGRPSILYRLTPDGVAHDRDEYRLLATMLAASVASAADGAARSYETGVRWGCHLYDAEPSAGVAELLAREGFAAEDCGDRIEMRRCPFAALAETTPQVICTLHQGIIDGALAASGSTAYVERLEPFVEPSLCVAHLRAA